jgi:hypothetical protein
MSSIRVNPNVLPDLLSALAQTRQQENTATLELASGSRINQPSDDPAGAAQMVANRDLSSQADTFLRSITSVNGLLQTADSTLSSVVTALQRAISLGVQGANGTLSNSDRSDVANELSGIQQQLISLANTSYQGNSFLPARPPSNLLWRVPPVHPEFHTKALREPIRSRWGPTILCRSTSQAPRFFPPLAEMSSNLWPTWSLRCKPIRISAMR